MSAENEITKFNQRWDARFAAVEDAAALFEQKAQTLESRYGSHVYTGATTIRVGADKDFTSLRDALNSLKARARPFVEIILDDGVHDFDSVVNFSFAGTNGLTVRSDSGNPHQCTIRVTDGGFGRADISIRDSGTLVLMGITVERVSPHCYAGSVGLRVEQSHVQLSDMRFIGPYDTAIIVGQNSSIVSANANVRGIVVEGSRVALNVDAGGTHCHIGGAGLIATGQHAADAEGLREVDRYSADDLVVNTLYSYGVQVTAPGRVRLSAGSVIDGFHYGYEVRNNGSMNARETTIRNCYIGARAFNGGHIVMGETAVETCHLFGIFAERGSLIDASEAVVDGIADASGIAFRAFGGSNIAAGKSAAKNADRGYVAQINSSITAGETTANLQNVTTAYEPPLSDTADDSLGLVSHS